MLKNVCFICLLLLPLSVAAQQPAVQSNTGGTQAVSNTAGSNSAASNQVTSNTTAAAQKPPRRQENFFQRYMRLGGPFMWPIIIIQVLGIGLILERLWFFLRRKRNIAGFADLVVERLHAGGIDEAVRFCRKHDSTAARIILSGLELHSQGVDRVEKTIETNGGIEISLQERGLSILAAIANIAPLLGFLGTVVGMIVAFQAIAGADTVSAKLVSNGIFQSLITTAFGLIVAIPAFAFHNFFVHRIDRFASEVEKAASEIIHALARPKQEPTA